MIRVWRKKTCSELHHSRRIEWQNSILSNQIHIWDNAMHWIGLHCNVTVTGPTSLWKTFLSAYLASWTVFFLLLLLLLLYVFLSFHYYYIRISSFLNLVPIYSRANCNYLQPPLRLIYDIKYSNFCLMQMIYCSKHIEPTLINKNKAIQCHNHKPTKSMFKK